MSHRVAWIASAVAVVALALGVWWYLKPRPLLPPSLAWERRVEKGTRIIGPRLAVSPNGRWFALAWAEGSRVWWLRGTSVGGKLTLDAPVALSDTTHPFTAFDEDPPKAAVDNEGQLAVAWMTRPLSHKDGAVIAVARPNLDRDGRLALTRIEPADASGYLLSESIQYDDDGRLLAVWVDAGRSADSESEIGSLQAAVASPQGAFEVVTTLADSVCACCNTSLAWLGPDRFALAWRGVGAGDVRDVRFAVVEETGEDRKTPPMLTPRSKTVVRNDGWTIQGCPLAGPSVGANGEASAWVTWYTEGKPRGVYLACVEYGKSGVNRIVPGSWGAGETMVVDERESALHPRLVTVSSGRPLVVFEAPAGDGKDGADDQARALFGRVVRGKTLTPPLAFTQDSKPSRPDPVRWGANAALVTWSEADAHGTRIALAEWRDL